MTTTPPTDPLDGMTSIDLPHDLSLCTPEQRRLMLLICPPETWQQLRLELQRMGREARAKRAKQAEDAQET